MMRTRRSRGAGQDEARSGGDDDAGDGLTIWVGLKVDIEKGHKMRRGHTDRQRMRQRGEQTEAMHFKGPREGFRPSIARVERMKKSERTNKYSGKKKTIGRGRGANLLLGLYVKRKHWVEYRKKSTTNGDAT